MRQQTGRVVGLLLAAVVGLVPSSRASADEPTHSVDLSRAAVVGGELSPGLVGSPLLAQRFNATLAQGVQFYAQPVTTGGIVIAAGENDVVYAVDEATGSALWSAPLGTPQPQSTTCSDLTGTIGITSTPVIDAATGTVYVTARDVATGSAIWKLWALDLRTGTARPGFPVVIAGTASNGPAVFDPVVQNQRPALTLTGGQVFAGFGSFCDQGAYRGWVAGVGVYGSARAGQVNLWSSEPDASGSAGAYWQSGGGFASDADGQLFVVSGNGSVPPNGPGTSPPAHLGNSVARLSVQTDGTLRAVDFFAPHDADTLSNLDRDLGSGSAVLPPDNFGSVPGHPHLLITGGKDNRIYVLDRDILGGRSATDAAVAETTMGQEWFGHAGIYNGNGGGWIYVNDATGGLRTYRLTGTQLTRVATNTGFGFAAGSPVITSSLQGAVVWVTDRASHTLQAFGANPAAGVLPPLFSMDVVGMNKFSQPAVDGDQVIVATSDGHLISVGPPATAFTAVEGTDAQVYTRRVGTGFALAGGQVVGAPAVTSLNGTPFMLATGTDGRPYGKLPTTGWYLAGQLSDQCVDSPAVTTDGVTLYAICHGTDNALWGATAPASGVPTLGPFHSLGGRMLAGPAVAVVGGVPTVLVNGTDNTVYTRPFNGSAAFVATAWRCIGHPALATSSTNVTTFACHGTDNQVWTSSATGTLPAAGATTLGGYAVDGVGVAASAAGAEVVIEGGDGAVWEGWQPYGGGFTGWTSGGGHLLHGASAADLH